MKITFNKPSLMQEYFSILQERSINPNYVDLSFVTNKLNYYIDNINNYKLLSEEKRGVPDSVFYIILKEIANVEFETKDYLEILSEYNCKTYNRIDTIYTTMLANKKMATRITYEAAICREMNFYQNHLFSVKELNFLTNNKSFVLIKEHDITDTIKNYYKIDTKTNYQTTDYDSFTDVNSNIYPYTLKHIKKLATKSLIKEEMEDYIKKLKEEINKITTNESVLLLSNNLSNDLNNKIKEDNITLKLSK